jgi:hypothetical protein
MVEPAKFVSHLTENLRASKAPERSIATGGPLAAQSALRIPIAGSLGEPFERRALEIRKFDAPRPPPVPARNLERSIYMPVESAGAQTQGSMHSGRLNVQFLTKVRDSFANLLAALA